MRNIDLAVWHCSATRETRRFTFTDCRRYHIVDRGWSDIGYHYYIERDGSIHIGRDIENAGAHAKGVNSRSIGICYEGGLDEYGQPKDTRTKQQKRSMRALAALLERSFPGIEHLGHRDLSPDLNHDGVITPDEWMKECPCFDVKEWIQSIH